MRLFVRASTIRAPTVTPPAAKVYFYGRQGTGGSATFVTSDGVLRAAGRQGTSGRFAFYVPLNGRQGTAGRSAFRIQFLGSQGTVGRSTFTIGSPFTGYAYNRIEVVERQADLTAGAFTNHVLRSRLSGTWLKQAALTGGRIRSALCYDLIFETLDTVPVRLDHEIEAYDGTAGTLDFALRLPSWVAATDQFRCRIRYGAAL